MVRQSSRDPPSTTATLGAPVHCAAGVKPTWMMGA